MNTPNKLTLLRAVLVPVFLVCYLVEGIPHNRLAALVVFATASLTDLLDGHLARKNGLVTDFGKFMDPLADKMLVTTALIAFVGDGVLPSWAVAIIIIRELAVTSLRLIAAGKGVVIAADIFGKYKTVFQMSMIVVLLLEQSLAEFEALAPAMGAYQIGWLNTALLAITLALTVLSGINYLVKNRECFSQK